MSDVTIALRQAVNEISRLRRENEILRAQVFVVETFASALFVPRPGGAMAPDPLREIERLLEAMEGDKQ